MQPWSAYKRLLSEPLKNHTNPKLLNHSDRMRHGCLLDNLISYIDLISLKATKSIQTDLQLGPKWYTVSLTTQASTLTNMDLICTVARTRSDTMKLWETHSCIATHDNPAVWIQKGKEVRQWVMFVLWRHLLHWQWNFTNKHSDAHTYTKPLVFDFLSGRRPTASGSIQDENRKERLREGKRNQIVCRS